MWRNSYTLFLKQLQQLINSFIIFTNDLPRIILFFGRRRSIFFFRREIYKHIVVIINFIVKMTRTYDWNCDKENTYDIEAIESIKPKHGTITNSTLRKKIDQNLFLYERDTVNQPQVNYSLQQQKYKQEEHLLKESANKRDNARNRCFDMRVTNIQNISQKITGLLNMVKKDRQAEKAAETKKAEEKQRQRREKSPHFGYTDRINKLNLSNKISEKKSEKKQDPQTSKFPDFKGQQHEKKRIISVFQPSVEEKPSQNTRQIRMKYLQQEIRQMDNASVIGTPIKKKKPLEEVSAWWQDVLQQNETSKQNPKNIKVQKKYQRPIQVKKQQPIETAPEKFDIEKMLEQRRKQRFSYVESVRQKSQPQINPNKSRPLVGGQIKEGKIIKSQHKESPISTIKRDFSDLNRPSDRAREEFLRIIPTSPSRTPSRRTDYSNLAQISYVQQEPSRQERATTTNRMIDDQLKKIKSKILQSQTNKKKIQSFQVSSLDGAKGKVHTSRIADSISNQVEFDSKLRLARQAFCKIQGESKWEQLAELVNQKRLSIERSELKQLITIGPDEHNPFSDEKSQGNLQELVELLAASERNWSNCVWKCASARNLKSQNFEVSDLDLSGKGYLALQDLVCFVNLYSNTFYRNRDLALVLRRLQMYQGESERGGIQYSTFTQAFSG